MQSASGRRLLEMQADRIEMVLSSHKVASRVWGGTVAPRFITFDVAPMLGTRVKSVAGLSEEIAMALGVAHCRVYRDGGAIRVEVPREQSRTVSLLGLCRGLRGVKQGTVVLGVDRAGQPLLAQLTSPDVVHILVAGTTGSGKTEILRCMVASLAYLNRQSECQLLLIDPKGRGLLPFAGLPHLISPPVTNPGDAVALLEDLALEMERRDRLGVSRPHIVLVIDELADLLMAGGREAEGPIARLVQRGRAAGVHVIGATQKPSASVISPIIRSNFPMRVVGRVLSAQDAHIAAGIAGSGAQNLLGRGDMLVIAEGQSRRFQGATVSEPEIRKMVRWLKTRLHPRGGVMLPQLMQHTDDKEMVR